MTFTEINEFNKLKQIADKINFMSHKQKPDFILCVQFNLCHRQNHYNVKHITEF